MQLFGAAAVVDIIICWSRCDGYSCLMGWVL